MAKWMQTRVNCCDVCRKPWSVPYSLFYGLIGPAHKAANLAAARAALEAPAPDPVLVESVAEFMKRVASIEWLNCTHCGEGRFVVIEAIPPSPLPRPPPQGPP